MTYSNYWKVIPQFAPLNGLHADICILRIGTVQAECLCIFVQWKFVGKIIMSVPSAYIECINGSYYLIQLTKSFLLEYRYWTFAKTSASTLWKKFLMSGIATARGVFSKFVFISSWVKIFRSHLSDETMNIQLIWLLTFFICDIVHLPSLTRSPSLPHFYSKYSRLWILLWSQQG